MAGEHLLASSVVVISYSQGHSQVDLVCQWHAGLSEMHSISLSIWQHGPWAKPCVLGWQIHLGSEGRSGGAVV